MSATELAPNHYARAERNALCDLFLQLGPDQPTLCEGWATKDLAGHLVVREGRNLLASFGIFVPPLQSYSEKTRVTNASLPWAQLVDKVRTGPPSGTMMRPAKLDAAINTIEFFVHHEDVRRAQPGWEPRELSPEQVIDLEQRVPQFAKRLTGKSPVGVVVKKANGRTLAEKEGPNPVTVQGEAAELVMFLFGRDAARVDLQGDPAAIEQLKASLKGH